MMDVLSTYERKIYCEEKYKEKEGAILEVFNVPLRTPAWCTMWPKQILNSIALMISQGYFFPAGKAYFK